MSTKNDVFGKRGFVQVALLCVCLQGEAFAIFT
jgi:hypothetical protein